MKRKTSKGSHGPKRGGAKSASFARGTPSSKAAPGSRGGPGSKGAPRAAGARSPASSSAGSTQGLHAGSYSGASRGQSGASSSRHSSRGGSRSLQGGRAPNQEGPSRGDKARWVVGLHSCEETLKVRPTAIRELWIRDDYVSSQQLRDVVESAEKKRIPVKTKSAGQLDQVGSGHQGVALAVTQSPLLDWAQFDAPGKCVLLALDGLEDPHNLGSIVRTAWLSGVAGILIPEDRAVGLTPAVCKVASGGTEHVPVESHTNLPSALLELKEKGFWIFGLSEKGTRRPWEFDLPDKVVWIIGSEGSGMRITTERACDELVRIPQVETGSSYNAAIAAAMALAETCRQFGKPE